MKKFAVLLSIFLTLASAHGQSWRVINPKLSHTIIFNKQNPRTMWVGNWANQVFRSYDDGVSWTLVEVGSTDVPNSVMSGATSGRDSNVVIWGGFGFDGVRRTSDGGETWARVLTDPSRARMYFISEALLEDVSTPGRFFGGRGVTNNGIWESNDNGATWDSVSVIPSAFTTRICTIAQRPDSSSIMFAGCKRGVITRSDDYGRTWRKVPVLRGEYEINGAAEIPKIVFSRRNPMTGYAVVAITSADSIQDNGGLLRTTDGGSTWDRMAFTDTCLWSVDVRDGANGKDDIFVGGFRTTDLPSLVIGPGLVFRSSNGGESWQRFDDIPWGTNELGDTLRNVWSIHVHPTSNKVYMTAETGTFIFDEPTSVSETTAPLSHPTLNCSITGSELIVHDLDPSDDHATWSIYTIQGTCVGQGVVNDAREQHISTSTLSSGQYLLTWGSTRRFRTARIVISR